MQNMVTRLGELLVNNGMITKAQLKVALEEQHASKNKERLGEILIKSGALNEVELAQFLSRQFGVKYLDVHELQLDANALQVISAEVAQRYSLIPLAMKGKTLTVATADPTNIFAFDDIKFMTGMNVEVAVVTESTIKHAIELGYGNGEQLENFLANLAGQDELELVETKADNQTVSLDSVSDDAPVVKLVNLILGEAIKRKASDIHIEPYETELRVRYRIDGILYEAMKPPVKLKSPLISRIKIMSDLDIAERRLPQDGRFKVRFAPGKDMDFRVSVLPTLFGEKIVMRLLDKGSLQLDMTKLGYDQLALDRFKEAIHKPFGMVLVTGPTGSGKTVSLYSALAELNKVTENISTVEDPVEFNFAGINQVQVHEDIGLNFAAALRSFLRQDPDIIMIGEIRDKETAEIGIKAALTGHLVLSTLHTNDAPSTISRLINMGVEPFLVASAVNLISAQRLARRLCLNCREPEEIDIETLVRAGVAEKEAAKIKPFRAVGCEKCNNTGYKGRVGFYQVMPITEAIQQHIIAGADTSVIRKEAANAGIQTMRQAGLARMAEGVTSLAEVLRVTVADDQN